MNNQVQTPFSSISPKFKSILEATSKIELKEAVDQVLSPLRDSEGETLKTVQKDLKTHIESSFDSTSKAKLLSSLKDYRDMESVKTGKYVSLHAPRGDAKKVIGLRAQLIEEYKVQTTSELLFIDIIVNAYFRLINLSGVHAALIEDNDGRIEYGNQQKINLIKEVGRQIESADHQLITALSSLRAFKQPSVNIKVQTKETYIAQNQQINKDA